MVILQNGCGLFSMLPDPKNKKTSKISTTISMVPRATMQKISKVEEDPKPKTTDIKCFEGKSIDLEEEVDEDDQEEVDFLGLSKINEIPDVEPVAGFELPEMQSIKTVIEDDDKIYGPVYCPEASESDLYEDDDSKLILDANAVCFYNLFIKEIGIHECIIYFLFLLQLKQLSDRDKTNIKQVEVINVNMSQVMEESQQWLQKNMTEEYAESKNVSSDINITGQSKRKHQITYLAQQVITI